MRLLLLMTDVCGGTGGIGSFNGSLLQALDELAAPHSLEVDVLAMNDKRDAPTELPPVVKRYEAFGGKRWAFALAAIRAAASADLIFFGHAHFAPLALLMPGKSRMGIGHGIEVWGPMTRLRQMGFRQMNPILTVSTCTRDQMRKNESLTAQRWEWFPPTLPRRKSEAILSRAALHLPAGRMLLSVSRLVASDAYKRIDSVIRCLPGLWREMPDVFYVVIGEGNDLERLRRVARKTGSPEKIHFIANVSDEALASYYEACDIFVLPSEREGFGIVFLEAMARRKACVGVQAAATPEVIEANRTGLLVPMGELPALEGALSTLLRDVSLRDQLGNAGYDRLTTHFSFDRFRARLEQALFPNKDLEARWPRAA
jgi:phosphatidyl-myo-inositol dimannoside synthase